MRLCRTPLVASALGLTLLLSACDAPRISGIAAGLGEGMRAPRPPLADPAQASFAFEPFPGVPGNLADDLTRRIWRQAEREGLTVVKRPGGAALFRVDGTLTAVSDDNNAQVFYVFDIRGVNGRLLHRISGQQRSEDAGGDPWAGVTREDLDVIATRLAALMRAWLYAS